MPPPSLLLWSQCSPGSLTSPSCLFTLGCFQRSWPFPVLVSPLNPVAISYLSVLLPGYILSPARNCFSNLCMRCVRPFISTRISCILSIRYILTNRLSLLIVSFLSFPFRCVFLPTRITVHGHHSFSWQFLGLLLSAWPRTTIYLLFYRFLIGLS